MIRGEIVTELSKGTEGNDFGLIQIPTGYDKPFSQMNKEMQHLQNMSGSQLYLKAFGKWVQTQKNEPKGNRTQINRGE